jgi:hypothetical protein
LFFKVKLSGFDEKKETDTHWRCQTREGNFNWRTLLNINGPLEDPEDDKNAYKLEVNLQEKNLFTSNLNLATFELDLYDMIQYCKYTNESISLTQDVWEGKDGSPGFKHSYND